MPQAGPNVEIIQVSWTDAMSLAESVAAAISNKNPSHIPLPYRLYGIPRGGIPAALLVAERLRPRQPEAGVVLVDKPNDASILIDDIIDSGTTQTQWARTHPDLPFYALVDKRTLHSKNKGWWVFPWERMTQEDGPEDNVRRILEYIGEDPFREGLKDTPGRVVRSWSQLYAGYGQDPDAPLRVFTEGACDEMVLLRDIEFYSMCEHHMLPFYGRAHIGYIPNGKIVGLSKLARLLEAYSRRLQIQERLGQQVTDTIMRQLSPKGCGCILTARHFCMTSRGVEKQNSLAVTSSMRGCFLTPGVKDEFIRMTKL